MLWTFAVLFLYFIHVLNITNKYASSFIGQNPTRIQLIIFSINVFGTDHTNEIKNIRSKLLQRVLDRARLPVYSVMLS